MKKTLFITTVIALCIGVYSFITPAEKPEGKGGIKWMTWTEMQEAQKKEPRKVVVDVYTGWCGWCKKMDASTFTHPTIIKYVGEKFYAVKFDAETRTAINFKGKDYKYVSQGNSGYNELAAEILNGQMSYPTAVYFDESLTELFPVPGYQDAKMFEKVLNFVATDSYKKGNFDKFDQSFIGTIK